MKKGKALSLLKRKSFLPTCVAIERKEGLQSKCLVMSIYHLYRLSSDILVHTVAPGIHGNCHRIQDSRRDGQDLYHPTVGYLLPCDLVCFHSRRCNIASGISMASAVSASRLDTQHA